MQSLLSGDGILNINKVEAFYRKIRLFYRETGELSGQSVTYEDFGKDRA
jgi:hypothetical protein